jgi:uncharacterized protein (TIGR02569 family)
MSSPEPPPEVLRAFGAAGVPALLAGGEDRTYRVGDTVLKHIDRNRENETVWLSDLFSGIIADGFRIAQPLLSADGTWLVGNWCASHFIEGHHDGAGRIPEAIEAIVRFHGALSNVVRPSFIDRDDDAFARADRFAWGSPPDHLHPQLRDLIATLYEQRSPVDELHDQLIHGDLNPENILFGEGELPAIIDIAPYWRPPEFALAVYAYWIGPWRDDISALANFESVARFDQMLVRAALRMLLIMSEFGVVRDYERYVRATQIVQHWVEQRRQQGQ